MSNLLAPNLSSPIADRLARPRWTDPRLLVGVLLVASSVVLGARVVAAADDSRAVWSLTRDLAAGSTLSEADVTIRQVRLDGEVNPYVAAGAASPVGAVLARDLAAGELLPAAAVTHAGQEPERLVTVPVGRERLPIGLAPGQRVDVYVATSPAVPGKAARQALAVSGARVEQVEDGSTRFAGGQGRVVLAVPVAKVPGLVSLQAGSVDLVRLP